MKYYLEETDRITRVFVKYNDIKDFTTFRIEVTVNILDPSDERHLLKVITINLSDISNNMYDILSLKGFKKSYMLLREKITAGSPIDKFLDIFETSLDSGEQLLLRILE